MMFILSLLLFFVLVRVVLPQVLRALLGGFVRQQVHKAQQQGGFNPMGGAGGHYGGFRPSQPPRPTGQVRVDYMPPQVQRARQAEFKGGEYVDYEEV